MKYLKKISRVRRRDRVGAKLRSLKLLSDLKYRIPLTMALSHDALMDYKDYPEKTEKQILLELREMISPETDYAVRSSSELEDHGIHSFAGQFKTFLNVKGEKDILRAIKGVWDSAAEVEGSSYFKSMASIEGIPGMGIVIQKMVGVEWSGVAFSVNPVTGRNEFIVEGIRGIGEDLVSRGKDPVRWIYAQGAWTTLNDEDSPGREMLDLLLDGMNKLKKRMKSDVDVEWAFDGKNLYYLQCRPVTTSKYPTIYANHISREVLPGIIKPLVWSVNIPLVNSAWIRLLESLLGKLDIMPEQLSESFYYRAYFNMGTLGILFQRLGLPKDSLESLMGKKRPGGKSSFKPSAKTIAYLPKILWFLISNLNLGRKFRKRISMLGSDIDQIEKEFDDGVSIKNYASYYRRILKTAKEAAYYNILIPLTMQVYNRMLKQRMEKRKRSFEKLDFAENFPRLKDYNPKYRIQYLKGLWKDCPPELKAEDGDYNGLLNSPASMQLDVFRKELNGLLGSFGHFSESGNDFSYPTWKEEPEFVFSLIAKGNTNPAENPETRENSENISPGQHKGFLYRKAGKYRLYREIISSEYTRGYGLFRKLFLLTGNHLAGEGKISRPEDVFLLTLEEHDNLLRTNSTATRDIKDTIEMRRKEMEESAQYNMPSIIYGDLPPPVARPDSKVFTGIPTSPGLFEGRIVVVNGYKDFDKDLDGAILIIPFADVGWTPILTRAAAIVSESGGMLSHASIIAREFSIPAIASVDHACSLQDGITAQIDGYSGTLTLNE